MTHDQINAKVAEILLAEGQKWGYIDHCYNCSQRDWWPCKPGGRDYSWGLAHCITGCREYALNEVVEPINFCSDPAAFLRLLNYLRSMHWRVAVHNDYMLNGELYTFWLLTHSTGIFIKGEGKSDGQALAEAFIAAKEKKLIMTPDQQEIDYPFRICEFCGCRTNAKLRCCCVGGNAADKAAKEKKCQT